MRILFLLHLLLTFQLSLTAQDLPYRQIPDYPETYTAGTVAARMVDGLGFRFYWATEGLKPETLTYQVSEEARTIEETVQHVFGLTTLLLRTLDPEAGDQVAGMKLESFEAYRVQTLRNLEQASAILLQSESDSFGQFEIVLGSGENQRKFPFWNHVNGPIADAIWHSGQIATLRRAAGDPISNQVSFLQGVVKE